MNDKERELIAAALALVNSAESGLEEELYDVAEYDDDTSEVAVAARRLETAARVYRNG